MDRLDRMIDQSQHRSSLPNLYGQYRNQVIRMNAGLVLLKQELAAETERKCIDHKHLLKLYIQKEDKKSVEIATLKETVATQEAELQKLRRICPNILYT